MKRCQFCNADIANERERRDITTMVVENYNCICGKCYEEVMDLITKAFDRASMSGRRM